MPMNNLWLLPAGIEDLLPAEATRLERLRRALVDHYVLCGYDLVSPPLVEHLDSLLSIGGEDLALETFKLTDHLSGRQLGLRADMTPQIARIDAHVLGADTPTRLCYGAPVLRSRTRQPFDAREQFQVGAELYGAAGADADAEIVELMLHSMSLCGFDRPHLDIGHVGVFRGISQRAGIEPALEAALFDALQRKSIPDLESLVGGLSLSDDLARALVSLPDLRGPIAALEEALAKIAGVSPEADAAADNLREVVAAIGGHRDGAEFFFDLSELRGYHYHTGVVFSAFVEGHGREVARGGRYDDVGAVFGRSRAATGFSLDLRQVIALTGNHHERTLGCILAPRRNCDSSLDAAIRTLRDRGERVVRALDGDGEIEPPGCDRRLVADGDGWKVVAIESHDRVEQIR